METHSIRRVLERDGNAVDYPLAFHVASDHRATDAAEKTGLAEELEGLVQPYGPKLVELFCRHVQPSFPILHKQSFEDLYQRDRTSIDCALLAAIYLLSLRWWSYDPELSVRPTLDPKNIKALFRRAVDISYHRPRLSSVQAMLLYLQCQPEDPLNPDHTYAWGLTCQALAISQCLGLHLDPSQWSISPLEKNVRKRLSWALFMQDRWTALAYGRPVHIQADDWAVPELTKVDFSDCLNDRLDGDSWSTKGHTQYMLMIRLTQILSEILSSFYTVRTSFDQDTTVLYRRAQPLLVKLKSWYEDVPEALSISTVYQRKLSFHGKGC